MNWIFSCYLNGLLPYVQHYISVNRNVLSASLKNPISFLPVTVFKINIWNIQLLNILSSIQETVFAGFNFVIVVVEFGCVCVCEHLCVFVNGYVSV